MDLKALLILAANDVVPVERYTHIIVDKKRFTFKYIIRKTKLTILEIKQKIHKKKHKKRRPITYNSSVQVSSPTRTTACQTKLETRDIAIETQEKVKYACKKVSVGVPFFYTLEKWTNTNRIYVDQNGTQTECDTWAIPSKCSVSMCNSGTQSENLRGCMPTQTELLVLNKTTQTSPNDTVDVDNLQNQFKYSLHIFNELCQMLLMQNNLLNSNFTMVYKLADVIHYKQRHSPNKFNVEKTLKICKKSEIWQNRILYHRKHAMMTLSRKPKMRALPPFLQLQNACTQTLRPILKTPKIVSFFTKKNKD